MKRTLALIWAALALSAPALAANPYASQSASHGGSSSAVPAPGYGASGASSSSGHCDPPKPVKPFVPKKAKVETWDVQVNRARGGRDPWKATLEGYAGDHVTIETQKKSAPIEIPLPERKVSRFDESGRSRGELDAFAHEQHELIIPGERQHVPSLMRLRGALRKAMRFQKFSDFDVPKSLEIEGGAPYVFEKPERLEVHAGLRITAVAPDGERDVKIQKAEGLETKSEWQPQPVQTTTTTGGMVQAHMAPWLTSENIRVTPAYRDRTGHPRAELLGLAAFPVGSIVRITNEDMNSRSIEGATVEYPVSKRTGSLKATLPVSTPDARYHLEVILPGEYLRSNTISQQTQQFKLPDPTSEGVRKGGLGW
jgi:hypothetical protein